MPEGGPLDLTRRWWLHAWVPATHVFLYAPIVILMLSSFNDSRRNIVWRGFTADYYIAAWRNASLARSLRQHGGDRPPFDRAQHDRGHAPGAGLLALSLTRQAVAGSGSGTSYRHLGDLGVALLVFFTTVGFPRGLPWPLNLTPILLSHVAFGFPFAAIVVRARLTGFDPSLEEASRDLGASAWQTFWNVMVPYLRPGLVAGTLLAMTLLLDVFVITFFTSGPDTITSPATIYSMVRLGATPDTDLTN